MLPQNFLVRFGESYTELFAGYDLLAIDYRGYGWSTPAINCFTSEEERQAFAAAEPPLLRASDRSHIDVWEARARDFAQRCRENASRVIRYGGSYAAAIDHVTVMKAMGQDKMSFWAVTSGAVVAQTVAFLYPQYVDKFLLDAPAAAGPDYTTTTATAKTIEDSNTALSAFLYTCLNADPQGSTPCNITGNSTTLPAIRARFDKIEADLRAYPDGTGLNVPSLPPGKQFTWSVFKYVETIALFVPSLFPLFAGVLAEVESGRLVGFVPFAAANLTYQPLPPLPVLTEDTSYYGLSIGACTDAARPLRSREAFDAYYADIEGQGPAVAPLFGTAPMFCKEWRVPTVNRYRGPLQVSGSELAKCGGKVVIVNNVADSASSLSNAREVRDAFGGGGSAVAVVESVAVGHTSFVAASACLFKVIAELFAAGIVPADGTRCEGIFSPPFGVQLPSDFSG